MSSPSERTTSSTPSSALRARRWGPRALGAGLATLLALALCWAAGHAYLNSDAMRARIRARVERTLGPRASWVQLGDTLEIDWLGRVTLGPVRLGAGKGQAPVIEVTEVRVRPSYRALLRGEVQPAKVLLSGVTVDATSQGARLRALLARALGEKKRGASRRAPPAPENSSEQYLRLEVEDVQLRLATEAQPWGPVSVDLSLWRDGDGARARGELELPNEEEVRFEVSRDRSRVLAEIEVPSLGPSAVPAALLERLPFAWTDGALAASFELRADRDGTKGSAALRLASTSLEFSGERLAPEPVGPAAFALRLEASWARRVFRLEHGELTLGPDHRFVIALDGELDRRADPRFRIDARVVEEPYAELLAAVPAAMQPDADAPKVVGTLGASLHLAGPLRRPHEWEVEAKLDLSKLDAAAPLYLEQPFTWQTPEVEGVTREVRVDPTNPYFVSVSELPEHVIRAITTSEDAGFFAHRGFDLFELKDSVISALESRRVRGASTITQQLAKNLFLSREKTYARKVKEALITLALEATLSKQRLLEIYLNIIEWGPGIHGLGEASRYYFGVEPRALTIKQAAYLATIIPNPVRYHVYFARGALTENWQKRLDDLLVRMHENGEITLDELAEARVSSLHFRPQG